MNANNPNHADLDEALGTSIRMAAQVASTIVLVGRRQYDRFCVNRPDGAPRVSSLEQLAHDALASQATWLYDPVSEQIKLLRIATGYTVPSTKLPSETGRTDNMSLELALEHFAALTAPADGARLVLLVDTGLLFEDAGNPRGEDFEHLRAIERQARMVTRSHLLLLRVPQINAIPAALQGNPKVRTVHVPAASRDVRNAYVLQRVEALSNNCHATPEAVARVVSGATEDWNLDMVDRLVQAAQSNQVTTLLEIEELSRAIRVGTAKSPWVGDQIRKSVSQADTILGQRVKGQPHALEAVSVALKKACAGLVGGHESRNTNVPRATLFFSGPTGTGKTELAKSIAQLVYGEESMMTRFDCSEFRHDHTVSRLLGSPPGYVGYGKGGELTEAVMAKPASVILFDEIEKAHPRLWDVFIPILADGRLTSGEGVVTDFSQAVIIFTSNLGMYSEETDALGNMRRVPRFGYDTPFETIQARVREAIQEEFVSNLVRPEILGRLGGVDRVIVFNYLQDLPEVANKFCINLRERCKRLHDMDLEVTPALVDAVVSSTRNKPEALLLGGRGLATELDRILIDPMAAYFFDNYPVPKRLRADWQQGRVHFEALS